MVSRRDLGNHAAEDAMHVLREDHKRLELRVVAVTRQQRRGCFVTGRLDAQNARHGVATARRGGAPAVSRTWTFTCAGCTRTPSPAVSRSATCCIVSPTLIASALGYTPRSRRTARRGPVMRTVSGAKRTRALAEPHVSPSTRIRPAFTTATRRVALVPNRSVTLRGSTSST